MDELKLENQQENSSDLLLICTLKNQILVKLTKIRFFC
jgi:hypothetical protein